MRLEHGFYHQTDQTCESKPKTKPGFDIEVFAEL